MNVLGVTLTLSLIGSIAAARLTDAYLTGRIAVLGSFAGLQYSTNPGVAFGISFPAGLQELLIGGALVVVLILALRTAQSSLSRIGFGLILGGGIANIVDRLPDGLVTDLFQVGSFPIFNVADSCITIGVMFLLLEMLLNKRKS